MLPKKDFDPYKKNPKDYIVKQIRRLVDSE